MLRAVEEYETHSHANVHRGVHALSQAATEAYEGARERIRRYINARSTREIIYVRGTTEGVNLVAQAYARYAAAMGSGAAPAPDFSHAVVRHALIDALERSHAEGRVIKLG